MKLIKTIWLIISVIFFNACSEINISKIINTNKSLELYIKSEKKENISVGSVKWKKIIQFANDNTKKWKRTPASYFSDISVRQGNFRLLYSIGKDYIVIGFTDKKGNSKQFYKKIKKGALDFLIE